MAIETKCSTPGAMFNTYIHPTSIEIDIVLPRIFDLTEAQAIHLENTIHNALELALTPLFLAHPEQDSTLPKNIYN